MRQQRRRHNISDILIDSRFLKRRPHHVKHLLHIEMLPYHYHYQDRKQNHEIPTCTYECDLPLDRTPVGTWQFCDELKIMILSVDYTVIHKDIFSMQIYIFFL